MHQLKKSSKLQLAFFAVGSLLDIQNARDLSKMFQNIAQR
jgi:hypothetical protein